MQAVELVTDFTSVAGGAGWVEAFLGFDDLRDAAAFDVLHGDEEAAVAFTVVVDFEGAGIDVAELLLDQHAAAFGFQGKLRVGIAGLFDNF